MVYKYMCVSVDNCNKTPKKIGPAHHTVVVLNKRKIYGFQTKATFIWGTSFESGQSAVVFLQKISLCSKKDCCQEGHLSLRGAPVFFFNASTFSGTLACRKQVKAACFSTQSYSSMWMSAALRLQTCTFLIWAAWPICLMFIVQCFLMFFFYLSAIHSPKSHWKTLYNIII